MFNSNLTSYLKSIILSLQLIDTGSLYKSIQVYIDVRDKIYIDIRCEDYIKYLLRDFNIIDKFTNNIIFITELEQIYGGIFNKMLEDLINGDGVDLTLPLPIILINGK